MRKSLRAGSVAWGIRLLLGPCTQLLWLDKALAVLWVQLPVPVPGMQLMMAQARGFLPPKQESQMWLLRSSVGLFQLELLWEFGEVSQWMEKVSFALSLCYSVTLPL